MSLSDFSLAGKVAIVVGARRNMGKAYALGLAEAGADVAITDVVDDGRLAKVSELMQQRKETASTQNLWNSVVKVSTISPFW